MEKTQPLRWNYFLYLVVLTYTAFATFFRRLSCTSRKNDFILFLLAFWGLGSMVYFFNRTLAGVACAYPPFVLLLAAYSDRIRGIRWKKLQDPDRFFSAIAASILFFVMIWYAAEGTANFERAVENRTETVWDTVSLKDSATRFAEVVPEDALAFGQGMPELYAYLGRKPQIFLTDWSDMNHFSIEELERALAQYDSCAVMRLDMYNSLLRKLEEQYHFSLKETIETPEFTCLYYVREKG